MSHQDSVAAVVVTYNRRDSLRYVIEALKTQSRPLDEIVVFDNASSDDTAGMMQAHSPEVTYIISGENLGAAGGFAAAMEFAHQRGHDWLWLFGDDHYPTKNALEILLDEADRYKGDRVGMLTAWLRSLDDSPDPRGWLWRGRFVRQAFPRLGSAAYTTDMLTFNGTLVSARAVSEVGLPRAEYFMGWEEWEYCLRMRRAGKYIMVVPQPLVVTRDPVVSGYRPPWRNYYQTRNHLAMVLQDRSPSELFWWAVRQVKFVVATIFWLDHKWARIRFRVLGAYHGLRGKMGKTIEPAHYVQVDIGGQATTRAQDQQ